MESHPFLKAFPVEATLHSPAHFRRLRGGNFMQGPLRAILAGAAAWKFGGGCISTILIFIIVFWALGYVNC